MGVVFVFLCVCLLWTGGYILVCKTSELANHTQILQIFAPKDALSLSLSVSLSLSHARTHTNAHDCIHACTRRRVHCVIESLDCTAICSKYEPGESASKGSNRGGVFFFRCWGGIVWVGRGGGCGKREGREGGFVGVKM